METRTLVLAAQREEEETSQELLRSGMEGANLWDDNDASRFSLWSAASDGGPEGTNSLRSNSEPVGKERDGGGLSGGNSAAARDVLSKMVPFYSKFDKNKSAGLLTSVSLPQDESSDTGSVKLHPRRLEAKTNGAPSSNLKEKGPDLKKSKYKIGGIDVIFPPDKKPFPAQLGLMAKAVTACAYGENAVLESPTGTGKSLALLCSVLSWQKQEFESAMEVRRQVEQEETKQKEERRKDAQDTSLELFRYSEISREKGGVREQEVAIKCTCGAKKSKAVKGTAKPLAKQNLKEKTPRGRSKYFTAKENKPSSTNDDIENEDDEVSEASSSSRSTESSSSSDEKYGESSSDDDWDEACRGAKPPSTRCTCKTRAPQKRTRVNSTNNSSEATKKTKRAVVKKTRVFIASRTHSQITQLVGELKRCPKALTSHLRMTVLASRSSYCINDEISRNGSRGRASAALNEECSRLLSADGAGCKFHMASDGGSNGARNRNLRAIDSGSVWDIEDLTNEGVARSTCPYFAAKETVTDASVIFCPYNYLIDPLVRGSMNLDSFLQDAVLVIDEAHNIEDVARDAASTDIVLAGLLDAVTNLRRLSLEAPLKKQASYGTLAKFTEAVATWLQDKAAEAGKARDHRLIIDGQAALALLVERCKLGEAIIVDLRKHFRTVCTNTPEERFEDGLAAPARNVVDGLLSALEFMFAEKCSFAGDYRVVISSEDDDSEQSRHHFRPRGPGHLVEELSKPATKKGRKTKRRKSKIVTLHLWCLNPAVAFRPLAKMTRSVILTSGTLSPTTSFTRELGVSFKYCLESAHVIDVSRQLWVGTVRGVSDTTLECTYANKGSPSYQRALGLTLAACLEHVPNGALCFFPSYSFMKNCVAAWQASKIWSRIIEAKPLVLLEGAENESFESQLPKYRTAVANNEKGALYMCVFRGRLSEGIDFSDAAARAVFVIGIPYPSLHDPKVKLKRAYQDERERKHRHAQRQGQFKDEEEYAPILPPPLTGSEWYQLQAFRALNQAVGRVIRHKFDYGAVVFLDHRFSSKFVYQNLSKWVRGKAADNSEALGVNNAAQSLGDFFAVCKNADFSVKKSHPDPSPRIAPSTSEASIIGKNISNLPALTNHEQRTEPDPKLLTDSLASMLASVHSNLEKFPAEARLTVVKLLTDALVAEFGVEVIES